MTDKQAQRFWSKVDKSGPCWLWMGAPAKDGYAQFMASGRKVYVHRWSWEMAHGPIPDGLLVCHQCDVPNCVRPDHLFLGTYGDNARDATGKGRWAQSQKTACPRGHEYTPENTIWKRNHKSRSEGQQRLCRACKEAR